MQTRNDKHLSRFKDSQTSRFRQNHQKSIQNLLFLKVEKTDKEYDKRMQRVRQSQTRST